MGFSRVSHHSRFKMQRLAAPASTGRRPNRLGTWSFQPCLVVFQGTHARVAQLDRASGYEPEGREFESLRAHHPKSFLSRKSPTILRALLQTKQLCRGLDLEIIRPPACMDAADCRVGHRFVLDLVLDGPRSAPRQRSRFRVVLPSARHLVDRSRILACEPLAHQPRSARRNRHGGGGKFDGLPRPAGRGM